MFAESRRTTLPRTTAAPEPCPKHEGVGAGSARGAHEAAEHEDRRGGSASQGWCGGTGMLRTWGCLRAHVLAAVRRETTQMIKGMESLISEGRLKGLNIYIGWLRAVCGETN